LNSVSARIKIHITPKAARPGIAGWKGEVLQVRVKAPPVEGRANAELVLLLAAALLDHVDGSRVRAIDALAEADDDNRDYDDEDDEDNDGLV